MKLFQLQKYKQTKKTTPNVLGQIRDFLGHVTESFCVAQLDLDVNECHQDLSCP